MTKTAEKKKTSKVAFGIAAFFLLTAAVNWYFYFNPTGHHFALEPIGLNFKTFTYIFGIGICVYTIINVRTGLGKIFWAFLLLCVLMRIGWKIFWVDAPIETSEMVGRVWLTISAIGLLFFAFMEKFTGKSLDEFKTKRKA